MRRGMDERSCRECKGCVVNIFVICMILRVVCVCFDSSFFKSQHSKNNVLWFSTNVGSIDRSILEVTSLNQLNMKKTLALSPIQLLF